MHVFGKIETVRTPTDQRGEIDRENQTRGRGRKTGGRGRKTDTQKRMKISEPRWDGRHHSGIGRHAGFARGVSPSMADEKLPIEADY